MGQQLALTGDLGIEYPSKGLRISGFAEREKGGNTTKFKEKTKNKEEGRETGKGKTN